LLRRFHPERHDRFAIRISIAEIVPFCSLLLLLTHWVVEHNPFGSEDYTKEELVAEMGAVMLFRH
jgi:hypothetical protein